MLFDDYAAQKTLERLMHRLRVNPILWEDLQHDVLVHLWLLETEKPGQSRSWYLQNCRFFLQHRMASGRSIDSPKHLWARRSWPDGSEGVPEQECCPASEDNVLAAVSADDMVAVLSPLLAPCEREILNSLAEGCSTREISRRLRVSHQAVSKRRRKIAGVAIRLGIVPAERTGTQPASVNVAVRGRLPGP